jgi:translation initiation factor 2B subunit (eIF-2B alpha/beta/delta family)
MAKKSDSAQFKRILTDIKKIKIQGAENVAKAGIKAYLLQPTKQSAKQILSTRPTEPLLQNAIKLLEKSQHPKRTAKKFLTDLKKSHDKISKLGSKLIKNDMNIYSHCHSSTVMDILKLAKKQKKKFTVYTSEVEPLLQGRITAKDLAKSKIKTVVVPDLAAEQTLQKCDIFFFGADAFTKSKVANKLGTSMLVRHAKLHNIPRYSCGVSLKFTNKITIQNRKPGEVWKIKNSFIKVENQPFDKTKLSMLTGIISEHGILKKKQFVKAAKQKLKHLGK